MIPDEIQSKDEVAGRMLDLIYDLGECTDSKQIIIAAIRRFRQLFGEFSAFTILESDESGQTWSALTVESPYAAPWGGLSENALPEGVEIDVMARKNGENVSTWLRRDQHLHHQLIDSEVPFAVSDSVIAVRMAAMTGAPCRSFIGAPWRRQNGGSAWLILGFAGPQETSEADLKLFENAAKVTSRMALYPSLIDSIARTEKINLSIRRNIVHDLKTPLTVIKGYAETLYDPELAKDQQFHKEMLEGITESCDRLLTDLKDILEPVDTAWEPVKEPFDLAAVVQKAVMAERHTERGKDHIIEISGSDEPIQFNGDLRKIRRVIENLLSNAIKYSPGAGKKVIVNLAKSVSEVAIVFQDQGLGMTQEQIDTVLSSGGRVVDATLGIEGSGFGLESTRRVLTAHGGRLEVHSVPGQGSTFVAFLPFDA